MVTDQSKLLSILRNYGFVGFPLSRKTWDWLEMSSLSTGPAAGTMASEVFLLRQVADRVNIKRVQSTHLQEPVYGGQLVSVGVLVDVLRYIIEVYSHEEQPGVISRGLEWTGQQFGQTTVSIPPPSFVKLFPPISILKGTMSEDEFLREYQKASSRADTVIREIILLFLSTANPAFKPFQGFFDDEQLRREAPYVPMIQGMQKFFSTQPPFGPIGLTLFECLFAPIEASPDSLMGQLDYIRRHWAHFLPLDLLERLLLAVDILEEERIMRGLGPGKIEALRFDRDAYGLDLGSAEPAAFSRDADWMSNVVLMAKSVYVWLFQLSRKYQRNIRLLSDIPDEELDQLARWGFSGLWLIGLWERSSASQRIKQIMGNPEAASSAYSLYDYVIAGDLGGEEAFQQLKQRAWQRGIRLASDMVPNHMGIYSKWVVEHPQWFLQSDYPPFPVYQYNGTDLSDDARVCLQIEDGYWQHRDAAVVFKRLDKWTGDTRYIYHGNDGTSMPWNDTAQLNFLLPEVREAVIQTILHVARKFPIIRFDAAMTLAKRHFQRLWFPQPGEGGAIPSRAEHGMTKTQFDALMPKEFWREVVDRIAHELPDTLLLAEAFWLMEGYFVRTLGMHRVYNSAFMNMLKMEDNAKYRTTVKNVLEFSPEVIKRFVNFMNNPDERSAVDQFGRGDKYFGAAMMMVTMPGLPMFGHGQIEGFSEKYGMEYRRSYWDEQVDWDMVHHHESHIFPLMRRRHLFSGAANFAFYDFRAQEGWVDENVFAYSNRAGDERAIILYNNAYNTTRGSIHTSTSINIGEGENTVLVRRSLAEALSLNTGENCFYIFRDYNSGLEYLRLSRQLADQGLFAELHAYQYQAFLDFREIHDSDGTWWELERRLGGNGVLSIDEAHQELVLEPILKPYRALMNSAMLSGISLNTAEQRDAYSSAVNGFFSAVKNEVKATTEIGPLTKRFLASVDLIRSITPVSDVRASIDAEKTLPDDKASPDLEHILYAWLTLEALDYFRPVKDRTPAGITAGRRVSQWMLWKLIREAFEEHLNNKESAYWDMQLVLILLSHSALFSPENSRNLNETFRRILVNKDVRDYLQIHSYDNVLWLNKERFEQMINCLALAATLNSSRKSKKGLLPPKRSQDIKKILSAAAKAGYQVEKLVEIIG